MDRSQPEGRTGYHKIKEKEREHPENNGKDQQSRSTKNRGETGKHRETQKTRGKPHRNKENTDTRKRRKKTRKTHDKSSKQISANKFTKTTTRRQICSYLMGSPADDSPSPWTCWGMVRTSSGAPMTPSATGGSPSPRWCSLVGQVILRDPGSPTYSMAPSPIDQSVSIHSTLTSSEEVLFPEENFLCSV